MLAARVPTALKARVQGVMPSAEGHARQDTDIEPQLDRIESRPRETSVKTTKNYANDTMPEKTVL
jgi:hypothetical protein